MQVNEQEHFRLMKTLSEKTGIEMLVIDEAEKITHVNATRLMGNFRGTSFTDDPIKSTIHQESPKGKTVELPGVSFLVDYAIDEALVDALNRKFSYRNCIAFISDDSDDKKHTVSIIHATDKYNIVRLQEMSGGSDVYATDSLILKLKTLDQKYPFDFIGVGTDWCLLKFKTTPVDYKDFAKCILDVCPIDEEEPTGNSVERYADSIRKAFNGGKRNVSMWWD